MTPPYRFDSPRRANLARVVPDYLVPERNGVAVWWSNIVRQGDWILPRVFRTFVCMGNVEIDLTSAGMAPGTSEIEVRCILGNVEIRVPPDIHVDCDGNGLGGNFDLELVGNAEMPPSDAPTLHVTGAAYLGSVTVKIMGTPGPGLKERLKAGWDFFYR